MTYPVIRRRHRLLAPHSAVPTVPTSGLVARYLASAPLGPGVSPPPPPVPLKSWNAMGAGQDLTQGSGSLWPTYNLLAGQARVTFREDDNVSGPSTGLPLGNAARYLLLVVEGLEIVTGGSLVQWGDDSVDNHAFAVGAGDFGGGPVYGALLGGESLLLSTVAADATRRAVVLEHSGTTTTLRVGAVTNVLTGVALGTTSEALQIGSAGFAGSILEVLAYNALLSGGDLTQLSEYLSTVYGVPLGV